MMRKASREGAEIKGFTGDVCDNFECRLNELEQDDPTTIARAV